MEIILVHVVVTCILNQLALYILKQTCMRGNMAIQTSFYKKSKNHWFTPFYVDG